MVNRNNKNTTLKMVNDHGGRNQKYKLVETAIIKKRKRKQVLARKKRNSCTELEN